MFPKKQRISSSEIKNLFSSNGKSKRTDLFLIKNQINGLEYPRFAIVIPKKVYKLATKRHFTKRKIVSIIKTIENIPNEDFIINLRKNVSSLSDEELKKELAKILI